MLFLYVFSLKKVKNRTNIIHLIPESKIFSIKDDKSFNDIALDIFYNQSKSVPVYKEYIQHLNLDTSKIHNLYSIPFLPIRFFKSHQVISETLKSSIVFKSSGTTLKNKSKHPLYSTAIYKKSL